MIPRAAVINSGAREIVYVASADGGYMPRQITTGTVGSDDMVELVNGLKANETVVTRGQFLLDSESRLSEAVGTGMHQHGGEAMAQMTAMQKDEQADHSNDTISDMHKPDKVKAATELSGIYTCPMPEHFHVLQYGAGKCPECGMKLVPIEETENTNVFVCPMPEDQVVSDSAGRCPKCNMKLVPLFERPTEIKDSVSMKKHEHSMKMKTDSAESSVFAKHDVYTCPMPSHFHLLQYGPGKCPECEMKLVPVTETDNTEVYVCPMRQCGVVQDKPGECSVCGMDLVKFDAEHSDD